MDNHAEMTLSLVRHSADSAAHDRSVDWAIGYLAETCRQQGITVTEMKGIDALSGHGAGLCILVSGPDPEHGADKGSSVNVPQEAESFGLSWQNAEGRPVLNAAGSDPQGIVYAILELADIVKYSADPLAGLSQIKPYAEKPAAPVRSINRLFVSEVEDKPWFYDKAFWLEYLTELATHRFNRLHLALGMGYDYGHDPGVKDNYFCFAYPYLLDLPGYDVKVKGLPQGEAERNLDMLRFISKEARLRGVHFQLGIWTHAYDPSDSPDANYLIEGVNPDNHAAYCRDALGALIQACPDVEGITIRTHYEGGIPEPAHEFWKIVFSGILKAGRPVELDLHAKGVDDQMLQVAIETGLPVVVSPKYWAEHMGPPYHQAAIRQTELPAEDTDRPDLMAITATYRKFTRYGYADFLKEDRKYGVLYRI
ncbi:hypothetical protein K0U00_30745, partial [Paenibacillus sepulcri]|nr:hypothetical protein [Paenibacillus sepulcri]